MLAYNATIVIKATPQQVFYAITEPELVRLWQYGKILTTNWIPRNTIKFHIEFEGKTLEQWGTILEIRPLELIKYKLFTPKPGLEDKIENYTTTSYILTKDNSYTCVKIIQEHPIAGAFMPVSLSPILIALKNVVESRIDTMPIMD